jgi:hypothetical protein
VAVRVARLVEANARSQTRCTRLAREPTWEDALLTLDELVRLLRDYAASEIPIEVIHARLRPVLLADPLDITLADATPWDANPHDERLFWRLVYLIEADAEDGASLKETMSRIVESLARTASAEVTHELLPVLLDQGRLCAVVAKHRAGIISRTGFLSVIAECGYPDHVKLWLQAASHDALGRLCERLERHEYDRVAAGFEAAPE